MLYGICQNVGCTENFPKFSSDQLYCKKCENKKKFNIYKDNQVVTKKADPREAELKRKAAELARMAIIGTNKPPNNCLHCGKPLHVSGDSRMRYHVECSGPYLKKRMMEYNRRPDVKERARLLKKGLKKFCGCGCGKELPFRAKKYHPNCAERVKAEQRQKWNNSRRGKLIVEQQEAYRKLYLQNLKMLREQELIGADQK